MKTKLHLLAAAAALALLAAGQAQAVSYNGETTGEATFNRPLTGVPPTGLSGVGTAVPYSAQEFTVTAAGSFLLLSIGVPQWDNFVVLYEGSFNPAAPLTNALAANDDYLSVINIGVAGFSYSLTPGTYFFVTTGFSNTSVGEFTNSITGPGTITLVPEPATYGMLALGLGLVALRRRLGSQA